MMDRRALFKAAGAYGTVGLTLVLSTVIGLFFGRWLDSLFGTTPLLLIVFLLLGIASGFLNLFRTVKRMMKDE